MTKPSTTRDAETEAEQLLLRLALKWLVAGWSVRDSDAPTARAGEAKR